MKQRCKKIAVGAVIAATGLAWSLSANATLVSGEIYYTTFTGGTNVHKALVDFDNATFSITGKTGIAAVTGADGITGNPNDSGSLLIGGQGNRVHRLTKDGTLLQTKTTLNAVFHLEVSDSSTLYGSSIPSSGSFSKIQLNADGSMGTSSAISIGGDDTTITQIITTPTSDFYTNSNANGFGWFGGLNISGGAATTTRISFLPAAHGGVYDPFSDSIILFGDSKITQLDLFGTILAELTGVRFDQGTVDGLGHLYAASNSGTLTFVDFAASGLIDNGFSSTQFLASSLDDIAPLVGAGSTTTVPEPATLVLMGLGLAGFGFLRRKKAA